MGKRPLIYSAKLSAQSVNTKAKVDITVVAEDIDTFYTETKYAGAYELVAGQEIGVI